MIRQLYGNVEDSKTYVRSLEIRMNEKQLESWLIYLPVVQQIFLLILITVSILLPVLAALGIRTNK